MARPRQFGRQPLVQQLQSSAWVTLVVGGNQLEFIRIHATREAAYKNGRDLARQYGADPDKMQVLDPWGKGIWYGKNHNISVTPYYDLGEQARVSLGSR